MKLEQAKQAVADGRLEQAAVWLVEPNVGTTKSGQQLIQRLVESLVKRGRQHLDSDRLVQAKEDAQLAQDLGGRQTDVAELLSMIQLRQLKHGQSFEQKQVNYQQQLNAARRLMDRGLLSQAGRRLESLNCKVDQASDDFRCSDSLDSSDINQFNHHQSTWFEWQDRQIVCKQAIEWVKQALEQDDLNAACLAFIQANQAGGQTALRRQLANQLVNKGCEQVGQFIEEGELDDACLLAQQLRDAIENHGDQLADPMPLARFQKALGQMGQAVCLLKTGQAAEASVLLNRLSQRFTQIKWIQSAYDQASHAAEAQAAWQAGPLGALDLAGVGRLSISSLKNSDQPLVPASEERLAQQRMLEPVVKTAMETGIKPAGKRGQTTVEPFNAVQSADLKFVEQVFDKVCDVYVMQIQGAETSLVVPMMAEVGSDQAMSVTFGPISGKRPVGVGMVADPHMPVVRFFCEQGDWFLQTSSPVEVNGKPVKQSLLRHHDLIALSPRCRLRFQQPHPASSTAVLRLSQGRLIRPDIRQVVLMADALIVDQTAQAHIVTPDAIESVILKNQIDQDRQGQKSVGYLKANVPGTAEGVAIPAGQRLPVAAAVNLNGLGLQISELM